MVVLNLRDALVHILRHVVPFGHVREKAVRVIQVLSLRVCAVPEVERLADRRCRRVVADRRQLISVVCVCQAVNPAVGAAAQLAVAHEARDVAIFVEGYTLGVVVCGVLSNSVLMRNSRILY